MHCEKVSGLIEIPFPPKSLTKISFRFKILKVFRIDFEGL